MHNLFPAKMYQTSKKKFIIHIKTTDSLIQKKILRYKHNIVFSHSLPFRWKKSKDIISWRYALLAEFQGLNLIHLTALARKNGQYKFEARAWLTLVVKLSLRQAIRGLKIFQCLYRFWIRELEKKIKKNSRYVKALKAIFLNLKYGFNYLPGQKSKTKLRILWK